MNDKLVGTQVSNRWLQRGVHFAEVQLHLQMISLPVHLIVCYKHSDSGATLY